MGAAMFLPKPAKDKQQSTPLTDWPEKDFSSFFFVYFYVSAVWKCFFSYIIQIQIICKYTNLQTGNIHRCDLWKMLFWGECRVAVFFTLSSVYAPNYFMYINKIINS